MDTIKITELDELISPTFADFLAIVNVGETKKITLANIVSNMGITGDTLPIGSILSYPGTIAPTNWLLANGQAVSRTDNAELFALIGTTYGVGDGSTTFNIPNLKGKVIAGLDSTQTEFDTLGEIGGEKTHTLTIPEMPNHNHADYVYAQGDWTPIGGDSAKGCANTADWTHYTALVGGGGSHNNLQPYIVQNYIIKVKNSIGLIGNVLDSLSSNSETDSPSIKSVNDVINPLKSGWTKESEEWTFVSVDGATGEIATTGDISNLYPGYKIAFENNLNTIFGIITSVFQVDGVTHFKFFHEIDPATGNPKTLMIDSAITENFYSSAKAPQGFDIDEDKWSLKITDTTSRSKNNPVANTFYYTEFGSLNKSIDPGLWIVTMSGCGASTRADAGYMSDYHSFSSSNNSLSADSINCLLGGHGTLRIGFSSFYKRQRLYLTEKKTFYYIVRTVNGTVTSIFSGNDLEPLVIKITCAYL